MTSFGSEFCPSFYICLLHSSASILEQKTFNFFTVTRHIHLWDLFSLHLDDKHTKPQCELAVIMTTAQLKSVLLFTCLKTSLNSVCWISLYFGLLFYPPALTVYFTFFLFF